MASGRGGSTQSVEAFRAGGWWAAYVRPRLLARPSQARLHLNYHHGRCPLVRSADADPQADRCRVERRHPQIPVLATARVHAGGCRAGGGGRCRMAGVGGTGRRPGRPGEADLQEEPAQHDRRDAHAIRRHHDLQQLLRVRHRQGLAVAVRQEPAAASLDRDDRRRGRQGRPVRHRRPDQAAPARGTRVPPAVRGSLVDGDSLDRHPAR